MTFKTFSMLLPILSFICSASAIKVDFSNINDVKFEDGSALNVRHVNTFLNSNEGKAFLKDVIVQCCLLDEGSESFETLKKHIFEQGHIGRIPAASITKTGEETLTELRSNVENFGMIECYRVYTDIPRSVFIIKNDDEEWISINGSKQRENAGRLLNTIKDAIKNFKFTIVSCNQSDTADSVEVILKFNEAISAGAIYQNMYDECLKENAVPTQDFTVCMYLAISEKDKKKYFRINSIFPMKSHFKNYEEYI